VTSPEDAQDRAIKRAIDMQDAIERADAIGTPLGLRGLFPTNLVHARVRRINLNPIQESTIMTKRLEPVAPGAARTDTPTSNAASAEEAARRSAGTQTGDASDPARQPILPREVPQPGTNERTAADEGEQGMPVFDPGPPPQRPQYTGGSPIPGAVDQLLMAAETRDRDAVRAVPTLNEPPAVVQYKANLLQWLDDLDAHKARRTGANAQRKANPDEDGDDGEEAA
jgi:hypothetical protein